MKECSQCGLSIEDDAYKCGYCQSDLTGNKKSQPVSGQFRSDSGVKRVYSGSYVYVLTNSAMSGLVKIGYTDIDPYTRASNLSATNVPTPFKVYGFVEVNNPQEVEKAVHKKLAKYRTSRSREFFKISGKKALETIESVSGQLDLKRQQESAESAERARKRAAQIKQEQFEQQVFETLNIVIEKLEKGTNIKLYKKLESYSAIVSTIIFLIGILSFIHIETETAIIVGIAWAAVGIIYLILSKIAKEKLEFFKIDTCNNMEAHFGQRWHPYKTTCISKIYQRYN